MHPNPSFRGTDTQIALDFAVERSFGTLAVSSDGAPLLSHVPFLLNADRTEAQLHLVRSNPICRAAKEGCAARIAVTGPDGYVSPDWYGAEDQVPTWNYIAVHLTGRLEPLPEDALEPMVAAQSAFFEGRLDKTPWTMDKVSEDLLAKFWRMILPFRFVIEEVDSTFKLNQNKSDDVRLRAADGVEEGIGAELAQLAAWMRNPPHSSDG